MVLWFLLRLGFAAALVWLAVKTESGDVSQSDALVAGGLALGALVGLTLTPSYGRTLFRRLSKVNVGPVGLELLQDAEAAAPREATEESSQDKKATSVVDLQRLWEAKLAYIAKLLLDDHGVPTFATVGSLGYDHFISDVEARTLTRLMTLRDEDLSTLAAVDRRDLLEVTEKVVTNIRASVLHGLVRKRLVKAFGSFTEIPRTPRADLLAEQDGRKFQIVPVFAINEDDGVLNKAKDRLRSDMARPKTVEARVVVVPHGSHVPRKRSGVPWIVDTDHVGALLGDPAAEELPAA